MASSRADIRKIDEIVSVRFTLLWHHTAFRAIVKNPRLKTFPAENIPSIDS